MTEKEKIFLTAFQSVIPDLSEADREKVLCFGEKMAARGQERERESADLSMGGGSGAVSA